MEALLEVTMLVLGLTGSFFSGLLGIGGAIINYPLLLFVPSNLGVASFTAQEVSAISMFQVFFASLAGMLAYRKKQQSGSSSIHKGLVIYMGSSILFGSLIGGIGSNYISSQAINILYGVLAIAAVILMLIPNREEKKEERGELHFNRWIAVSSSFVVGIVSGIVGAGGAFILIPLMLTVLKIPIRTTIASSLAIVFISAVGGVAGKVSAGPIPLVPTLFVILGSLIGAPLGSNISSRIHTGVLRYGLVILIAATAVKIWSSVL
ncbi:sulfite exporter TauE/SafE family protein [Paenibacillus sp. y28]|uniref:sulfite exporter TauE/SafE family protein n=1 Tax=Paenibacillus sp. y28 TaxID=3129110 RepID=UPI003015CC56